MQYFHNVKLPDFVSIYALGGPSFSTFSSATASGRECRVQERSVAVQKYVISGCILSHEQFEEFNGFFRARFGQQYSFRMKDHADYELKHQIIADGDEDKLVFGVFKTYYDIIKPYNRRISKLSDNSYINVNGSIDIEEGVVTINSPLSKGEKLIINGEFDVTVRFMNDDFKYSTNNDGSIKIEDIPLLEVL